MTSRLPSVRAVLPCALACLLMQAAVSAAIDQPAAAPASRAGTVVVPGGEFWMGRTRLWLMDEIGWQTA